MKLLLPRVIFSIIICSAINLQSQHIRTHVTSLQHDLPAPYVRSVFVDSIGTLWLGTLAGLFTYNGATFEPYSTSSSTLNYVDNLIPFNEYIIVHNARALQIINTNTKQTIFQSKPDQTFDQLFNQQVKQKVYLLFEADSLNSKFISLDTHGKIKSEILPIHNQRIVRFAVDQNNGIYYIDKKGSFYYSPSPQESSVIDQHAFKNLPLVHYPDILISKTDQVQLIGTESNKINRYSISENKLVLESENSFPGNLFQSINNNQINLYSPNERQLSIYDLFQDKVIDVVQLPKDIRRAFSIYTDDDGRIWIPYESVLGSGLYIGLNDKSNFNSVQFLDNENNVQPVRIRDIIEDHDRNILASGLDGIFYTNTAISQLHRLPLNVDDAEFKNCYGLIRDDRNQHIWMSRSDAGFYKLDNTNEILEYITPETPETKITTSLYLDKKEILWIGAWNNITWYDINQKTFLPSMNRTPSFNNVRSYHWVNGDSTDVWLCSSNGLFLFDEDRKIRRWYHQKSEPPLSSDEVYDITRSGNQYFIATNNGLNILHQDSIAVIGSQQGFASNIIASILLNKNDVWLGTYSGLTQYNKNTGNVNNYYEEDGLPNNEFNRVARYASSDGTFYFGTQNGLVHFHPDSFYTEKHSTNLILQSFSRYDNQGDVVIIESDEIGKINAVVLPAGNKYFQVEVALLQYINSAENKYTYFLEGLESNWRKLTTNNSFQYNNVPTGHYTLRVKAMDHAGVWSANELSIPLIVKQHFYKSWWFLTLIGCSIVALFYAFYNIRLEQAVRIERLRTKLSSDLHDDVGSLLSGVAYQMELLEYTVVDSRKPLVQKIAASSRKAMNHMRDVVWAIDARNNTCEDLLDRIAEFAADLLLPLGISFEMKIDEKLKQTNFPSEYRHDILLICKEFLTNTVKHAQAKQVKIHVYSSYYGIVFFLMDDGIGITESGQNTTGHGLRNIKMRAKKLNAKLEYHYENGFGITLNLPALR